LLEEKILDNASYSTLKALVKRSETVAALRIIESENFTDRNLATWKSGPSVEPESGSLIPEKLQKRVVSVLELKEKEAELLRTLTSLQSNIKKIFENQTRLRENIKSLEKMTNSDLVKRYLKDLDKEEDDLIRTRESIDKLEVQKTQLQTSLKDIKYETATEARKMREILEAEKLV